MKIGLVAGFIGFGMLGLALGGNPFGYASLLVSLGFAVGAIIWWLCGFKKKDPYDLSDLARVHADEERRAIEDELMEMDSAGNAICLTCGNHFDPMLNLCPRCGRSIYQ